MIERCQRLDPGSIPGRRTNLLDAFLAFFEDMVEIVENLLRRSEFEEVYQIIKTSSKSKFQFSKRESTFVK